MRVPVRIALLVTKRADSAIAIDRNQLHACPCTRHPVGGCQTLRAARRKSKHPCNCLYAHVTLYEAAAAFKDAFHTISIQAM